MNYINHLHGKIFLMEVIVKFENDFDKGCFIGFLKANYPNVVCGNLVRHKEYDFVWVFKGQLTVMTTNIESIEYNEDFLN